MSIHALVVDTGARRIVVDTCIGNDKERSIPAWSNLQTPFLADLAAAGYRARNDRHGAVHPPARRSRRLEHDAGRMASWVPTFPNARYLIGRSTSCDYWRTSTATTRNDGPVLRRSVRAGASTRGSSIWWRPTTGCATRYG